MVRHTTGELTRAGTTPDDIRLDEHRHRGYPMTAVDSNYGLATPSMSAQAVRAARFSTKRHGWDDKEVRAFLDAVANDIQSADAERAAWRAELHELRAEVQRLRGTVDGEAGQTRIDISIHAVGMLSQAQQTADSCVAEAEQYARDLVNAARSQYQEILQNARQTTARTIRELAAAAPASIPDDNTVSMPEIEYVRTFAGVAQMQLRSILDALIDEVDKLSQLPRPDDVQHAAAAPTEVSWEPSNRGRG